ncbi:MAG: 2-dehydropantoate 2-reductase [Lautropia sp.]|nr:2-dehydropantoate 2-reductase [Lautropia sp.]
MRIAVLGGGGAMGGLFGAYLADAGHEVILVDVCKEAVEAIRANGLIIEEKDGSIRQIKVEATSEPASVGTVDLVISFVKCYHTEAAITLALPMIGPRTQVLSLQNGWGNADRIAQVIGPEKVLVGVTYHSATLLAPGRVKHPGTGQTSIGKIDPADATRLDAISEAFTTSGLDCLLPPRIETDIWKKLALNACVLPLSACLGWLTHELAECESTREEMMAILREVIAVTEARGHPLDFDERWQAILGLLTRARGAKPSMLQDVDSRRQTEIDVINGAVVKAGKAAGVPTPHNAAMYALIRAIETKFQPLT